MGITLVDDDGVLVIASRAAVVRRYAARDFDYSFPRELVAMMNTGELVAWRSDFEGDHVVSLEGDRPAEHVASDSTAEAIGPYRLRVESNEDLLLVPYSMFTYIASGHGDFSRLKGRLGAVVSWPAGTYAVVVRHGEQLREGAHFVVELTRAAESAPTDVVTDVPGWSHPSERR